MKNHEHQTAHFDKLHEIMPLICNYKYGKCTCHDNVLYSHILVLTDHQSSTILPLFSPNPLLSPHLPSPNPSFFLSFSFTSSPFLHPLSLSLPFPSFHPFYIPQQTPLLPHPCSPPLITHSPYPPILYSIFFHSPYLPIPSFSLSLSPFPSHL